MEKRKITFQKDISNAIRVTEYKTIKINHYDEFFIKMLIIFIMEMKTSPLD